MTSLFPFQKFNHIQAKLGPDRFLNEGSKCGAMDDPIPTILPMILFQGHKPLQTDIQAPYDLRIILF